MNIITPCRRPRAPTAAELPGNFRDLGFPQNARRNGHGAFFPPPMTARTAGSGMLMSGLAGVATALAVAIVLGGGGGEPSSFSERPHRTPRDKFVFGPRLAAVCGAAAPFWPRGPPNRRHAAALRPSSAHPFKNPGDRVRNPPAPSSAS